MNVLIVEDDAETAAYTAAGLRANRHTVDVAATGTLGLALAGSNTYDAIVVDRMLPELDGLKLVKALRGRGDETPVLFLTTMNAIDDRVEGLEAGGDDYLVKPFALSELGARLTALVRRAKQSATNVPTKLVIADVEVDLLTRKVARGGKPIELQLQEFKLLEYLMRNAGCVVTRAMLLQDVWGLRFDPQTNIVESHMSRLRSKLVGGAGGELIRTIRGEGYVFHVD